MRHRYAPLSQQLLMGKSGMQGLRAGWAGGGFSGGLGGGTGSMMEPDIYSMVDPAA